VFTFVELDGSKISWDCPIKKTDEVIHKNPYNEISIKLDEWKVVLAKPHFPKWT
jgi:hypothetical protein